MMFTTIEQIIGIIDYLVSYFSLSVSQGSNRKKTENIAKKINIEKAHILLSTQYSYTFEAPIVLQTAKRFENKNMQL